eukprot:3504947-Rhodomonas_salina.1
MLPCAARCPVLRSRVVRRLRCAMFEGEALGEHSARIAFYRTRTKMRDTAQRAPGTDLTMTRSKSFSGSGPRQRCWCRAHLFCDVHGRRRVLPLTLLAPQLSHRCCSPSLDNVGTWNVQWRLEPPQPGA